MRSSYQNISFGHSGMPERRFFVFSGSYYVLWHVYTLGHLSEACKFSRCLVKPHWKIFFDASKEIGPIPDRVIKPFLCSSNWLDIENGKNGSWPFFRRISISILFIGIINYHKKNFRYHVYVIIYGPFLDRKSKKILIHCI